MIDNPIPKKYRSEHLILLVGSNPLPNWVAGTLLCKPEGKIYLVHSNSKQIGEIAKRLAFKLGGPGRCKLKPLDADEPNPESNPQKVYEKIRSIIDNIKDGTIGLNYTGGTKVMSVHAHKAATNPKQPDDPKQPEKRIVDWCSYLNAHTLTMVITDGQGELKKPIFVGNSPIVRLTVEELLNLHGNELDDDEKEQPNPRKTPIFVKPALALRDIHLSETKRKEWNNWCNPPKEKGHSENPSSPLRKEFKLRDLPETPNLIGLKQAFQQNHAEDMNVSLDVLAEKYHYPDFKKFKSWFIGFWLEDYVFQTLVDLKDKMNLHEIGLGYTAKSPKFEIDVLAMTGYQLVAFSCTRNAHKRDCKQKLLEVYTRARQIGGDEANTALVCYYHDTEGLETEMAQEFDAAGRIKVFGLEEIVDLKSNIKQWLQTIKQRSIL